MHGLNYALTEELEPEPPEALKRSAKTRKRKSQT